MAGKASKKQVQTNIKILGDLYKVAFSIAVLALLRSVISRSESSGIFSTVFKFVMLHLPFLGCLYTIEISGRPKFDVDQYGKRKIVKEGLDLSVTDGLLQYLFDLVYLSLFADVGKIIFNTNKLWYALLLCPIYVGYKLYGLKNQFFGSTDSKKTKAAKSKEQSKSADDVKSKRQMKKEKKGDNQMKYRYR